MGSEGNSREWKGITEQQPGNSRDGMGLFHPIPFSLSISIL